MWSLEVSLRLWAEGRAMLSLSTCPPCRGFCCLFAALQTRAPLSWVLGRRRAALGHRASGGHWKHGPSSVPRAAHWGGSLVALVAIPWPHQHCWGLVQSPHFSGHPSAHRVKLPMARPPALHVHCSRMGLACATAIKMKGRLGGEEMIIIKTYHFFPFKIAARQAHST